jgi:hypothetical protein
VLGFIKARNGEKKCPARRNRKREDSDDFIKEIPPQTPGRSSKKRQIQSTPNSIPLSREKGFHYHEHYRAHPPVREDGVDSGIRPK